MSGDALAPSPALSAAQAMSLGLGLCLGQELGPVRRLGLGLGLALVWLGWAGAPGGFRSLRSWFLFPAFVIGRVLLMVAPVGFHPTFLGDPVIHGVGDLLLVLRVGTLVSIGFLLCLRFSRWSGLCVVCPLRPLLCVGTGWSPGICLYCVGLWMDLLGDVPLALGRMGFARVIDILPSLRTRPRNRPADGWGLVTEADPVGRLPGFVDAQFGRGLVGWIHGPRVRAFVSYGFPWGRELPECCGQLLHRLVGGLIGLDWFPLLVGLPLTP